MATLAPSRAKRRAMAFPMPLAAPVMMADLSLSLMASSVQTAIGDTFSATTSSASVAASTSFTVMPGAVSRSVARPLGKAMTAKLGHHEIHGAHRGERQRHSLDDLGLSLGRVLHGHQHPFGAAHQVHRPTHARHHLSRDHPVREHAPLVHLEPAEDGHIDVAATDQREGHRAVERACAGQRRDRPAAGIGEPRLSHARLGDGTRANQAVLGLEKDVDRWRNEIRDQRRNADAEIHQHAVAELQGDAFGDQGLCVHGLIPPR